MAEKKKMEDMEQEQGKQLVNCLSKRKVLVKYIIKPSAYITDPKHLLYGGLSRDCTRTYCVPVLASTGTYVNVLTDAEKAFLEDFLGLGENALSVYRKVDNFWDNIKITLGRDNTILDLSDPMDYIKWKVLLANKNAIAPSIRYMEDHPRETYRFVLIDENEVDKDEMKGVEELTEAMLKLGNCMNDKDKLMLLLEFMSGKPVSSQASKEKIVVSLSKLVKDNPRIFLGFINDPLLDTKILIRRCAEEKLISRRSNLYYLASDGTPLCDSKAEPELKVAAAFLADPKRAALKNSLEEQLNTIKQ